MKSRAVFLDRDGTIIEDVGYLRSVGQVKLLPGAAAAIRRLAKAGFKIVLISNQSGIARGMFSEQDLTTIHDRMESLLKEHGAALDGAYYCPYLDGPAATVDQFRRDSDCRKPKPGMLLQAAEEFDIDLAQSWMIGDALRDVSAGAAAGCRTMLLARDGRLENDHDVAPTFVVEDLREAANLVERDMMESVNDTNEQTKEPIETSPSNDSVIELLKQISDQQQRTHRERSQHDFSLLKLFGTLLQMLAIVVAIWGTMSLLDDQHDAASARLLLACFLQISSISTYVIDHNR